MGPGAGGQIQGFMLDAEVPQRAYFSMDVEGAYRTDDGGLSWFTLPRNNVCAHNFDMAVKPGTPSTVYLGTFWGLLRSTDTGAHWSLTGSVSDPSSVAFQMRNQCIGTIAVDPRLPSVVYAAPQWRVQQLSFNVLIVNPQEESDTRWLYFSLDSGVTWHRSMYEPMSGWKQVHAIVPDPVETTVLWVAAHSGLYRGQRASESATTFTWTKVQGPLRSDDMSGQALYEGKCYGLAFSPDGAFMYAAWGVDPPNEGATYAADGTTLQVQQEGNALSLPFIAKRTEVAAAPANDANWRALCTADHKGHLFVADNDTEWGDDTGKTYESKGNRVVLDVGVNYWRPVVDPRSTGTRHKVLLGEMDLVGRGEAGLFEGDFTITDDGSTWSVSGKWARIFAANAQRNNYGPFIGGSKSFNYNFGWQNLTSRARYYAYSPTTWPGREIWVAADQNLYKITTLGFNDATYPQDPVTNAAYYTDWNPVTTTQTGTLGGKKTFTNRGITSTVDYDATASGNYVLFVGADNAMYESYDAGASVIMSQAVGLGQGDTCLIVEIGADKYALASQAGSVFGGGSSNGFQDLYAKKIVAGDPSDVWIRIAGGTNGLAGLKRKALLSDPAYANPNQAPRILGMSADPVTQGRIYLCGSFGIYVIDDLAGLYTEMKAQLDAGTDRRDLVASQDWARKIYDDGQADPITNTQYLNLFVNPDDPARIYFATATKVIRLLRDAGGSYAAADVYASLFPGTNIQDFTYWRSGGNNHFVVGTTNAGQTVRMKISPSDANSGWTIVCDRATMKIAARHKEWLESLDEHFGNTTAVKFAVRGLAGTGDTLIASYYSREFRRGILLKGTVQPGATPSVVWSDWQGQLDTGSTDSFLYQAWVRRGRIVGSGSSAIYLAATQGAGTWKRPLVSTEPPVHPAAPTDLAATPGSAPDVISLTWSDASINELAFEIQRRPDSSAIWTTTATPSPGIVTLLDRGLAPATTYQYRVRAVGANEGASAWTSVVSATTPGSAFNQWTNTHGLSGNDALADADPDGDGLGNLIEFALGSLPNSSTSRAAPQGSLSAAGRLQITFERARGDLTYLVEGCSDLSSWTPIVTNPGSVGQTITVDDILTSDPQRFLRVKITMP